MHHLMCISTATAVPLQATQCKQDCLESKKNMQVQLQRIGWQTNTDGSSWSVKSRKSTLTYRSGSCAYNELKGCVVSQSTQYLQKLKGHQQTTQEKQHHSPVYTVCLPSNLREVLDKTSTVMSAKRSPLLSHVSGL